MLVPRQFALSKQAGCMGQHGTAWLSMIIIGTLWSCLYAATANHAEPCWYHSVMHGFKWQCKRSVSFCLHCSQQSLAIKISNLC